MNPPFQLPLLIALATVALAIAAFGSWRGSAGLKPAVRGSLLALRLAAIAAAAAILFNPGKWVRPDGEKPRPWIILTDTSSSMVQATPDGKTRAQAATVLVQQASAQAKEKDIPLRIIPFAASPGAETSAENLPLPTGVSSQITPTLSRVLQDAASAGESLAGIIVLSDGRETLPFSQAAIDDLALRARSRNTAIHTFAIGAGTPSPDLALIQNRATLTAFPKQSIRIPFALESTGLDPQRATVALRREDGSEISSLTLDVPAGKTTAATFEATAPDASTRWTIDTPVIAGEARRANNRNTIHVRIIKSKTRVFLAEGAPYWDSKFLAQLLRQQPHMDVHSVHRLSEERYFRIDSGSDATSETAHPVFPANLSELSHYDLIIFGKNVDPFLTPERAEALRSYVRDHGAAVLFSRGKPTTADLPALEPLEPVVWAANSSGDFRFKPTADGETAGLFGQALPAPDASLWNSLPVLKDGRLVSLVKPFTRVLAEGKPESSTSAAGAFPALVVRRYGQGVVGLVNGDGLWRWDFYPEARELGNHYEDYWTQLIQWMASYSEFLPSQEFSLRLPSSRGAAGVPQPATLSYRGPEPVPQPRLLVTSPSGATSQIQPAALPDPSGRPLWRTSFTPDAPGEWKLSVVDPREKAPPVPEVTFTVPHPPAEDDDLSPDSQFLAAIATATGGEAGSPQTFTKFLETHLAGPPPANPESGAVWKPLWNHAAIALLLAALLAAEWFFRRRQGLA